MEGNKNRYNSVFQAICLAGAIYFIFEVIDKTPSRSEQERIAQLADYLDASVADIDNKMETIEERLTEIEDKLNI